MSKKRVLQKIAGSILLASVVVGGYMGKAYAEVPAPMSGESIVSYYSTQYVWFYKEVKGVKFMRLYDATNEKWVGPWIWCP